MKPDFKKNDLVWYIHPVDRVIKNGVMSDINEATKYWVNPEYYIKDVGSCKVCSRLEILLKVHIEILEKEIRDENYKIEKAQREIISLERLIKINKELYE